MKLWIVGKYRGEGGSISWDFVGVFDNEDVAVDACLDYTFFVGPAYLNEDVGNKNIEWPGCYYPRSD